MEKNNYQNELKPHQYQELYLEEDGPLHDIRKSLMRKLIYLGFFLFLLMSLFSFTIPLSLDQSYDFILKSNNQEEVTRFPELVFVNSVFIRSGQKVKMGDTLAEISSPSIVQLISEYNIASKELEVFYKHDTLLYKREVAILQLKRQDIESSLRRIENDKALTEESRDKDIEKLTFENEETKRRYEISKDLYNGKAISEKELKDSELALARVGNELNISKINYEKSLKELASRLESLHLGQYSITEQLDKLAEEIRRKEDQLLNNFLIAKQKILMTYGAFEIKNANLLLKANTNGIVSYVLHTDKEVPPEAVLYKIVKNLTSMYALAAVPPDRVGYIKSEQKAVLKLNTFPHYEWGTLKGRIKNLSSSPNADGDYPFEIEIIDKGKPGDLLQVGMDGKLSVTIEEKTLMQLIFSKFYKTVDRMVDR